MQGVGTRGRLGRPDAEGRRPDGMSTQRHIQSCDLRLVRPVPQTHPTHQAQSDILADALSGGDELLLAQDVQMGYQLHLLNPHLYPHA